MVDFVLDASAVLAHLNNEPGGDFALSLFTQSAISTVNLCEVHSKMVERGDDSLVARYRLEAFGLDIMDADAELAFEAGALRGPTRPLGLSLGDRFCIALGRRLQLPVYTAERRWLALSPSMDIRLIR